MHWKRCILKETKKTRAYEISVRTLVEFILRSGDIVSGFSSNARALEGTRLHQKLQKAEKEGYAKEVPFQKRINLTEEIELQVEGRADGIYTNAAGERVIDEIKSTASDLEYIDADTFPLHWAQAKCYAYMLAEQEALDSVTVRLSYIHSETEEVKYLFRTYAFRELEIFWQELIGQYEKWILWKDQWDETRTESLQQMTFPFPAYRAGQRTMAAYIYKAIQEQSRIFLQAPTGIGKTVSAIFPALKAMGLQQAEKIFYLTAKNVTGQAAVLALERMRRQGLRLKSLQITAKDKICPLEKRECDPVHCDRARGHFDRVNAAVLEALQQQDRFDKETIGQLAERHQVCPFELSLDIATWVDFVICDYNYAFDPTASLKRFFQEKRRDYVLLVDEAHNLVDRSREMFSAQLHKQAFLDLRSQLNKKSSLYKRATKLNELFLEVRRKMGEEFRLLRITEEAVKPEETASAVQLDERWYQALRRFTDKMEEYLEVLHKSGGIAEEIWQLYFQVLFFLKIWDQKGSGYECYFQKEGRDIKLRFFCADPSEPLRAVYAQVRSVIFFSATLMPVEYYKELLGGGKEETAIALPSPFDPERKKIMIGRIRATYQERQQSLPAVCTMLHRVMEEKEGHYMVFFPSFAYLEQAYEAFTGRWPQIPVLRQKSQMTEEERMDFLAQFEQKGGALLGFCVLGGVFSEGIDLKGESLIGVIIVSVGIPQIGTERNLIRDHMEKDKGRGYEYAYLYPGIGKVFQAAGRVIRTESDKGIILLLDERFDQERYYQLYPPDWYPITRIQPETLGQELQSFWQRPQDVQRSRSTGAVCAEAPQTAEKQKGSASEWR